MSESFVRRIQRRWIPWLIAHALKFTLKGLFKTCRLEVEGLHDFLAVASKGPSLLMLWHNRLTAVAAVLEKHAPQFTYVAFVSQSRDGEIVAAFTKSYQAGRTIRVPHNRRDGALKAMVDHLKSSKDVIMITPDGPKGPVEDVKPGVLFAALESAAPIIPFSWSASSFWRMPTWDGLMIPKPFARVKVRFGKPIYVNKTTELASLKQALEELGKGSQ